MHAHILGFIRYCKYLLIVCVVLPAGRIMIAATAVTVTVGKKTALAGGRMTTSVLIHTLSVSCTHASSHRCLPLSHFFLISSYLSLLFQCFLCLEIFHFSCKTLNPCIFKAYCSPVFSLAFVLFSLVCV